MKQGWRRAAAVAVAAIAAVPVSGLPAAGAETSAGSAAGPSATAEHLSKGRESRSAVSETSRVGAVDQDEYTTTRRLADGTYELELAAPPRHARRSGRVTVESLTGVDAARRVVVGEGVPSVYGFGQAAAIGRCPANAQGCGPTDSVKRMFLQFPVRKDGKSVLEGKRVLDATLRVSQVNTAGCSDPGVQLFRTTGPISAETTWENQPSVIGKPLGVAATTYREGTQCPGRSMGPILGFSSPDLTRTVAGLNSESVANLTLRLAALEEGSLRSYRLVEPEAVLAVHFIWLPAVPSDVGISPSGATSVTCAKNEAEATFVREARQLRAAATLRTAVPSEGADAANLRAEFTLQGRRPGSAQWQTIEKDTSPESSWTTDGVPVATYLGNDLTSQWSDLQPSELDELQEGWTYRMWVRARSGTPDDSRTEVSGNSKPCYFRVDVTHPGAPSVRAVPATDPTREATYAECRDDAHACYGSGGPGIPGRFRFQPAAGDVDVVGYEYSSAGLQRTADNEITFTPSLAGVTCLSVRAVDAANNVSEATDYCFLVSSPPPPVGDWRFTGPKGTTPATATNGVEGGAALALRAGAHFDLRGRQSGRDLGDEYDHSLGLDGVDDFARATDAVLDTSHSFTTSAWVWLDSTDHDAAVVSQADSPTDTRHRGVVLGFTRGLGWTANWHWAAGAASKVVTARGPDGAAVAARAWTHLAMVFVPPGRGAEGAPGSLTLYVNGRPGPPLALPASAAAAGDVRLPTTGSLNVGRADYGGTMRDYFPGLVDEVAVVQAALLADYVMDSVGRGAGTPVGEWSASAASGTSMPDGSPYRRAPLRPLGGVSVDGVRHAPLLDGRTGALSAAAGRLVDMTGSFAIRVSGALDVATFTRLKPGQRVTLASQQQGGTAPANRDAAWAIYAERGPDMSAGRPTVKWAFERRIHPASDGGADREKAVTSWSSLGEGEACDGVVGASGRRDLCPVTIDAILNTTFGSLGVEVHDGSLGLVRTTTLGVDAAGTLNAGRVMRDGQWRDWWPGTLEEVQVSVGTPEW